MFKFLGGVIKVIGYAILVVWCAWMIIRLALGGGI